MFHQIWPLDFFSGDWWGAQQHGRRREDDHLPRTDGQGAPGANSTHACRLVNYISKKDFISGYSILKQL